LPGAYRTAAKCSWSSRQLRSAPNLYQSKRKPPKLFSSRRYD
jgi:hypothetical protein